jgi:hypothetical protein
MAFRRELAKALLREIISAEAEEIARGFRSSARCEEPGLLRDSKLAIADAADGVAEDPAPLLKLIEAWWDRPPPGPESQDGYWN